ncbi:MAG: DUF1987 domain-containing protein [Desulfosporosinus sp.]|nr:DUF1987 domain-containing protein [Desulfosporosinus sp.]
MERLVLKESKSTPFVDFDADKEILLIKGQAYPEDAFLFFRPLLEWLKEYLGGKVGQEVRIEIALSYTNTSSSKCIMMILDLFEKAAEQGVNVTLKWICNEHNEYEQECAEEFKEDYTFPFEIVLA